MSRPLPFTFNNAEFLEACFCYIPQWLLLIVFWLYIAVNQNESHSAEEFFLKASYSTHLCSLCVANTETYYAGLHFCCAMLCISLSCAVVRCLSVRPSVMFAYFVKTNKHIFTIFLPLDSHSILVFPYQTLWQYSDRGNNCDFRPISQWSQSIECRRLSVFLLVVCSNQFWDKYLLSCVRYFI